MQHIKSLIDFFTGSPARPPQTRPSPEMKLHNLRQRARAVADDADQMAELLQRMGREVALVRRDALLIAHTVDWFNSTVKEADHAMRSNEEIR